MRLTAAYGQVNRLEFNAHKLLPLTHAAACVRVCVCVLGVLVRGVLAGDVI